MMNQTALSRVSFLAFPDEPSSKAASSAYE